jgi:hypothetical protein
MTTEQLEREIEATRELMGRLQKDVTAAHREIDDKERALRHAKAQLGAAYRSRLHLQSMLTVQEEKLGVLYADHYYASLREKK